MSSNFNSPARSNLRRLLLALAAATAVAGSAVAVAHHAFAAEYDADKPLDLSGTVTKARWVNPHSWLYLDVKSSDGVVTNWGFEMAAPNALASKGIAKEDLKPGSVVHIKGFRSKSGEPTGYAATITLPDGRSFQTGGAPNNPGGGQ